MKFIYACDIHGDIDKYEQLYKEFCVLFRHECLRYKRVDLKTGAV